MKVHVELDMTPEEARGLMGLPDVAPLQKQMMDEMQGADDQGDGGRRHGKPDARLDAAGRAGSLRAIPEIPVGQRPGDDRPATKEKP